MKVAPLIEAIKLLHGYNEMVKRDPQYKLNKPYSPKTDIDDFLYSDEIKPIYKSLLKNSEIIRHSKHEDFGDYDKKEYDVELLNGEELKCWPNAGAMMSLDGSGRMFDPADVHSFKISPTSEC